MTHQVRLTSAIDLFSKSYNLVRGNLKMFLLFSSVSIAASLIAMGQQLSDADTKKDLSSWENVASSALGPDFSSASSITGLGILVGIFSIVGVVFALMMLILALRTAQGKKPNFDAVWAEFRQKGLKLFLLFICVALALLVGFLLLVIPGVILLWRLSMAPYLMLDKGTDISESFVQSWEMTKGYAWPIYSIYLVSIALAIANFVPIIGGLIALGLGIAYTCAIPLRYEEIKNHHKPKV